MIIRKIFNNSSIILTQKRSNFIPFSPLYSSTMSFSSRRRNYLLTPHRSDGLMEWMKSMLMHSFVLDALDTTAPDTFSHFEMLIDEHRLNKTSKPSRLKQLVPTVGNFHTRLPLRRAFEIYNEKNCLTKRKHIQVSFSEIRHILNLAQVIAMRTEEGDNDADLTQPTSESNPYDSDDEFGEDSIDPGPLNGPKLITFDGDQTLYSDGANFDSNPRLARYLLLLLLHGVNVAVVTAAGYEYNREKYEFRLSGLLEYFKAHCLSEEECGRFYLFGGECNYLLRLGSDFRLHPVPETGPSGWMTCTNYLPEAPGTWSEEEIKHLLDVAEASVSASVADQKLRGRVIRKKRSIGLIPNSYRLIPREGLDESVLRAQVDITKMNDGNGPNVPYCAFNGGRDMWVDVGNKRVGVQILQSFLGIEPVETLHIGDQFLNTGNDYAARDVCPCIWITSPEETTYILKTILRLSGISVQVGSNGLGEKRSSQVDFSEIERRSKVVQEMDVYTGEMKKSK